MDLTTLTQPPWLYVVIGVAAVLVALIVVAVVAAARRRREREELRRRYGAEYERTLQMHRNQRAAIADLKEREQLHDRLDLRDLNDADRDLVRRHMAALQFRFVEDPADVLVGTDRVVTEVLRAMGYPVGDDREQAVRLFSVDHPEHAGAVREVLQGRHDGDVAQMRTTFLSARRALAEVAGISYVPADAASGAGAAGEPAGDDLRVEHTSNAPLPVGEQP